MPDALLSVQNNITHCSAICCGSGPRPFWHQGWVSCKTIFPLTGGVGLGRGDGSGGNASDGERFGAADEASLAGPPLTSCCAAGFLTGCGHVPAVPVRGLGFGDPCVVG